MGDRRAMVSGNLEVRGKPNVRHIKLHAPPAARPVELVDCMAQATHTRQETQFEIFISLSREWCLRVKTAKLSE